MRYKIFGRHTGLRVSALALGAGNFGTRWGHGTERAEAKQVFDAYVEAGGFLTGKYRSSEEGRLNTKLSGVVHTEKTTRETAILDEVLTVAKEIGASPTEVAIAWLLHRATKSTTSLIPILGSRTREQLDATLGALAVELSPDQIGRLDAVSAMPLGTPHEQINSSAAAIAGGQPELLEATVIPVA